MASLFLAATTRHQFSKPVTVTGLRRFQEKKLKTHLTNVHQRKLRHFEACKKPYINKTLHKIIMKRSQQSKNKANKTRNTAGVLSYKKQRSYVVKLNN